MVGGADIGTEGAKLLTGCNAQAGQEGIVARVVAACKCGMSVKR